MKKKQQDVYGEPKVITRGNVTVRIFRPILTPEERARRERVVIEALKNFARNMSEEEYNNT